MKHVQICILDSKVIFEGDEKQISELKRLFECLKNCGIELEAEYEGVCG